MSEIISDELRQLIFDRVEGRFHINDPKRIEERERLIALNLYP